MSLVYVLNNIGGHIPFVESYELIKKNPASITVKKRQGQITIRKANYLEFIFSKEELEKRFHQILINKQSDAEKRLERIKQAIIDGPRIDHIPADNSWLGEGEKIELDNLV